MLAELGRGEIELTHEAFHTLQPWRAAAHLEELLNGLQHPAPGRPTDLRVRTLDDQTPGHHRRSRACPLDQAVRRLGRGAPAAGTSRTQSTHRQQPPGHLRPDTQATRLLGWLAERELTLTDGGQADIDAWHVEHPAHARNSIRGFLLWCIANKLTRDSGFPPS
ncbi:hypothetical protein [Nocardia sp. NPDC057455]|uniref:hypothetical protein n=1 Tax=Nocardia sp. NPDC057455 TaxID=3346138 RepID=UPI00366D2ACB